MMTWSSVLYTTARWSAAPPVATRFSSSPTPSNITFLDRIMVIRWWWWGRPSPSRSLSTIQRAQRKAYFNFWDENSLLSISCFKTRMRICSFNLRLQDENKNWNSDNSRDNGDAVGYCGHDDVKMLCNIDPHKYLTFGVKNKKGFGECISAGCLVWFPHTPSVTIFSGWVFGPNNRCLIYATQLMCGNNLFRLSLLAQSGTTRWHGQQRIVTDVLLPRLLIICHICQLEILIICRIWATWNSLHIFNPCLFLGNLPSPFFSSFLRSVWLNQCH